MTAAGPSLRAGRAVHSSQRLLNLGALHYSDSRSMPYPANGSHVPHTPLERWGSRGRSQEAEGRGNQGSKMEPFSRQGRSPISLLGSTMFYVVLQFSNRKRTSPPTCGSRYRCRSIGTRWLCVGDGTAFLRFICGTFCFFFFILTRVQAIGTAPPGVDGGAPGLNGWCNLHSVSQDRLLCLFPAGHFHNTPWSDARI